MTQKNHKITISIIISIAIITLSIIYIIGINSDSTNQHHAQRGTMDLTSWKGNKNIYLEGEWEFYPNVLLSPQDDFNQYENIKKYVQVPGTWEPYLNDDGSVDGSGTYRLRINLPSDDTYGIKSRTIRYSSRIYMNGEEIISVGNPSRDRFDYIAKEKNEIGFSNSERQELDLIINVSSYDYTSGGITNQIIFGTFDSILKQDRIDRTINAISLTLSLGLGLFFLTTYFQRSKNKELLYISIAYLFIAIYLGSLNEQLLDLIIDYDIRTRTRIQLLSVMIIIPSLIKFVYHLFNKYGNEKIINIIIALNMFSMALAIITVEGSFISIEFSQYFVLTTTLIAFLQIFYLLIKAIHRKDQSLGYILVIASSLFTMWIGMMVTILFEMEHGKIGIVNIMIIMITISVLISDKLQSDYRNVQSLSKKLIKDDKLKDEFLARASHELNTPLHIILNSTQSLIEGKTGTLNPKQQESLYFINQEGKRMTNLVGDLLDASRMKRGEIQIRLRPFNAYTIVEDILREIAVLIPKDKDISLINSLPENLPNINGDPEKFTQIIYNLLNNAINYTEFGEIKISGSLKKVQATFKIIDTGIGIKEEDKGEIFEVFYKNDDNNTEKPGMGLGLPITKHLVEIQGGEIRVESRYGKGTSFIFTLPIYEGDGEYQGKISTIESVEPYEPRIEAKEHKIGCPTILIVDDRLSNRKVLADILYDSEYNILFANDGKETIEALDKDKIDLIVLDYMLPDMSGDEVSRKIREKYSLVELPILMLTASGRAIDMEDSFHCEANDFLRKPANPEELISRIKSLLSMKKSVEDGLKKEFQYFYSQISPHFLYNTINTIIGLSYKDTEKSRKALTNLAIYFRGKLEMYKGKILIPLKSELELVVAYLEIEEMRYGDRLKVEIDIDEDIDSMIPPLTIQPLVENSIGHGIIPKGKGSIKISSKKQENLVIINIEDDGVGMSEERQKELLNGSIDRLGFKNVMEKIKIIKGARLDLNSQETEGTRITIMIPEVNKYASNISG